MEILTTSPDEGESLIEYLLDIVETLQGLKFETLCEEWNQKAKASIERLETTRNDWGLVIFIAICRQGQILQYLIAI